MKCVGMNAYLLQQRIAPENGNWLESLHKKSEAVVIKAFSKNYCDMQPTENEFSLMVSQSQEIYNALHVEDSIRTR